MAEAVVRFRPRPGFREELNPGYVLRARRPGWRLHLSTRPIPAGCRAADLKSRLVWSASRIARRRTP